MNVRRTACVIGWLVVSGFYSTTAAQVAEPPWNISVVGQIGGYCLSVQVEDRYAYVCEGPNMTILDVSVPSSPVRVGLFSLGEFSISDIQVKDDLAYLAGVGGALGVLQPHGLQIVDVRNSRVPRPLGFYPTPVPAQGVCLTDGLAYVTCGSDLFNRRGGLQVIDVSNPTSPTLHGSFIEEPFFAWRIYVTGNTAYVAARDGLHIFDVTNPSHLARLALYRQSWCNGVVVTDRLAYTAIEHGLEIVDVTSPTAPQAYGYLNSCYGVEGLFFSGALVFLAAQSIEPTHRNGLAIVDASNPSSPTLIGSYLTPGWARDVVVSSGTAYLADWMGGLSIIDVTTPSSPTLCATYDTLSDPTRIRVVEGVAYVANGVRGLKAIDVSNPWSPTVLGSLTDIGAKGGLFVSGNRAYVCDNSGATPAEWRSFLHIVDITTPSSPSLLGSYSAPEAWGIGVSGDLAYVTHNWGFHIVDVTDPTSPTLRGLFDTPGGPAGIFVSGDLAYVADYTSLQIVDVRDPALPFLRSSFPGFRITLVYVFDGVAYITGSWSGADFECVDVTDPDNPRLLGKYDCPDVSGVAGGLAVSDGFAYVLLDDLRVLDVSDPSRPTLCGFYPAGRATFASDLLACGNLVYLVDTLGLRIFQFTGDNTGAGHWRLYR